MINIVVWSAACVSIEEKDYMVDTKKELLELIHLILDKAYYSGETLCLESAVIVEDESKHPKSLYTEIQRWK